VEVVGGGVVVAGMVDVVGGDTGVGVGRGDEVGGAVTVIVTVGGAVVVVGDAAVVVGGAIVVVGGAVVVVGGGITAKLAVTYLSSSITTEVLAALEFVTAPPVQLTNFHPDAGMASRSTTLPGSYW
jgi:hypothetical protein